MYSTCRNNTYIMFETCRLSRKPNTMYQLLGIYGLLPENQCGFRGGRGTVDMIFVARQLQEKCQEQYDDLFITFIDLTKAFDTVCRDGLWQIMKKFGCPRKLTTLVRQLHDGMRATVLDSGDTSDSFPVTNGGNRAVFSPLPSSAWYPLPWFAMLHKIMTMASN